MAQSFARLPVKWQLRPVLLCTANQNVYMLHARFLAYAASCPAKLVEDFAEEDALPKVALAGNGHLSHSEGMAVTISSPVGNFSPESFMITRQELMDPNKIFCKRLKLRIGNPLVFDVDSPMELSAIVGNALDGNIETSVLINWPCMHKTVINNITHSGGVQLNYHGRGNSPVSPLRFSGHDTSDSAAEGMDVSTPLVKPTPVWASPATSDTSSPYCTPPESLESTPPKISYSSKKGAFSPIKKSHPPPDEDDSGISSLLSDISLRSMSPQSGRRSHRGSESEVSVLTQNLSPTVKPTPRKSRCQSVPSTPHDVTRTAQGRPSSSLTRRRLYSAPKTNERPPWKP